MNMKSALNGPELVTAQQIQISCFFIVGNPVEHVDLNHVRLKFEDISNKLKINTYILKFVT